MPSERLVAETVVGSAAKVRGDGRVFVDFDFRRRLVFERSVEKRRGDFRRVTARAIRRRWKRRSWRNRWSIRQARVEIENGKNGKGGVFETTK